MSKSTFASIVLVVLFASSTTMAQDKHIIKPQTVISEIVEGMPKGDKQQVRVLTATFQPRDQTMFHTPFSRDRLRVGRCVYSGEGGPTTRYCKNGRGHADAAEHKDDGI